MVTGTVMAASQHFTAIFPLSVAGFHLSAYSAFYAFIVNFAVAVVLSVIFNAAGVARGADHTHADDYLAEGAQGDIRGADRELAQVGV
jgi:hypothetical protein